jgi:hypothetical protein
MTAPQMPNLLHTDHGGYYLTFPLGEVHSVGVNRDHDGFSVWFKYGGRADLTPADLRKVLREGAAALARLHFTLDDVHDACGGEQ